MPLHTALTELFDLRHPIVLAPMGGVAGGALAAAVSNAGGLGLVGSGDREWLERELSIVADTAGAGWGIGFLSWAVDRETVQWVRDEYRPRAVLLSFGDPRPYVDAVRAAGATLMVQVTDHDEARRAVEVGADVIVAQGGEAGGHGGGGGRSTLTLVPAIADLVHPTPVLAAGGIADGRGLAAALTLGAAGVLVGTRFQATHEAVLAPEAAKAIVAARGSDTSRNRVYDIARRSPWPTRYTARMLRNEFFDSWQDREAELRADTAAQDAYLAAVRRAEPSALPVWAGEAVDLIDSIDHAADVVARIAEEADTALGRAARRHIDDV